MSIARRGPLALREVQRGLCVLLPSDGCDRSPARIRFIARTVMAGAVRGVEVDCVAGRLGYRGGLIRRNDACLNSGIFVHPLPLTHPPLGAHLRRDVRPPHHLRPVLRPPAGGHCGHPHLRVARGRCAASAGRQNAGAAQGRPRPHSRSAQQRDHRRGAGAVVSRAQQRDRRGHGRAAAARRPRGDRRGARGAGRHRGPAARPRPASSPAAPSRTASSISPRSKASPTWSAPRPKASAGRRSAR